MSRRAVLRGGRRAAGRGMRDTCEITRDATDPDGGAVTATRTVVYAGRCRVQQQPAAAQTLDTSAEAVLLQRLEVHMPMTVTGLRVGDEVRITASVDDPDLPGRVFTVQDLAHKSDATARRVGVRERTS